MAADGITGTMTFLSVLLLKSGQGDRELEGPLERELEGPLELFAPANKARV